MKELLNKLTYRQMILVRGLTFSLLLYAVIKLGYLPEYVLTAYLLVLPLRFLYYYELTPYKYKVFPLFHFIMYDANNADLDTLEHYKGAKKGSKVYAIKSSFWYETLVTLPSFISFCVVSLFICLLVVMSVHYILTFIHLLFSLTITKHVFLIGMVLGILYFFVKPNIDLKRARIMDNLEK